MEEIWKAIPSYEGIYDASNLGNIRSRFRTQISVNGANMVFKQKTLKPTLNRDGYHVVLLYNSGKRKLCKVHKLIALTFLDNTYLKPTVNHINGNKLDNTLKNLEWATLQEQSEHALSTGLFHKKVKGTYEGKREYKRAVMGMATGIFYDSIREAHSTLSINTNYKRFVHSLSCGYQKNFILI